MIEPDAQFLTGLLMLGIAWAFRRADPHSDTSAALALALALAGVAIFANTWALRMLEAGTLPRWAGLLVVPEVVAFCAMYEWVRRVRRTVPARELRTTFGDGILWVAAALAVVYGINSVLDPEMRLREFFGGIDGPGLWTAAVMSRFVLPLAIGVLLWMLSIVLCLNRDPAPPERVRLLAFLVGVPLLAGSLVLPGWMAQTLTVIGVSIMIAGALSNAELRGRQGQFMQRFLSPQVAEMVNRGGLRAAMGEQRREISVVCVDLRGFTAYAAAQGSDIVIDLLRRYYDAVGAVVQAFEGTIKDYAGDGVLILIGAPVPAADHAARAASLARAVRAAVTSVTVAAGTAEHPLGVGVGVASGAVTLGVVGGEGPLEYAAVGSAVNLASRLCEQAAPGEILVAQATRELLGDNGGDIEARAALSLKGFAAPVAAFALVGETAA